ncbi:hypothetical protein MTO96_007589 [Rhipicephalus appendiculatus]
MKAEQKGGSEGGWGLRRRGLAAKDAGSKKRRRGFVRWHDEALDSYGNFGRTLLRLGPEPPEPALAAESWDVCRRRASWSGSDAFKYPSV